MTDPYQQGPPPYGPYGPGQPMGAPYGPPPENHLVWAILSTVLCCLPLGIVSIVKSNQVNTFWAQGLTQQAHQAADEAKKWAMWSAIVFGILVVVLGALYVILIAVAVKSVDNTIDSLNNLPR